MLDSEQGALSKLNQSKAAGLHARTCHDHTDAFRAIEPSEDLTCPWLHFEAAIFPRDQSQLQDISSAIDTTRVRWVRPILDLGFIRERKPKSRSVMVR